MFCPTALPLSRQWEWCLALWELHANRREAGCASRLWDRSPPNGRSSRTARQSRSLNYLTSAAFRSRPPVALMQARQKQEMDLIIPILQSGETKIWNNYMPLQRSVGPISAEPELTNLASSWHITLATTSPDTARRFCLPAGLILLRPAFMIMVACRAFSHWPVLLGKFLTFIVAPSQKSREKKKAQAKKMSLEQEEVTRRASLSLLWNSSGWPLKLIGILESKYTLGAQCLHEGGDFTVYIQWLAI